jgi:hypothetical protein
MHTTAKEHAVITRAALSHWLANEMSSSFTYKPKPGTIQIVPDPQVTGTYAVQFTDEENADTEGGVVQLLFVTGLEEGTINEVLEATLEEVEFESWPPQSGSLRFFV